MDMDFETKGALLIKTKFGTVSATAGNFTIKPEDMAENGEFLQWVDAESGVFCLVPWELDIPF